MNDEERPIITAHLTPRAPHDYSGAWMAEVEGDIPGAEWRAPFERAIEHLREHHELGTERE